MFSLPQLKALLSTLNINCGFTQLSLNSSSEILHRFTCVRNFFYVALDADLHLHGSSLLFLSLSFGLRSLSDLGSQLTRLRHASWKIICQKSRRVKGISSIWYCNTTSPLKILLTFSSTQTVCRWCQFQAIETISRCVIRRLLCKGQVLIR